MSQQIVLRNDVIGNTVIEFQNYENADLILTLARDFFRKPNTYWQNAFDRFSAPSTKNQRVLCVVCPTLKEALFFLTYLSNLEDLEAKNE